MFMYPNEIGFTIRAECDRINSTKSYDQCDENCTTNLSRITLNLTSALLKSQ